MSEIMLCADDFALNPGCSQGIVNLLELQRLSATSVLVRSPHFQSTAGTLTPFLKTCDIGLHFDLTEFPIPSNLRVSTFGRGHAHLSYSLLYAAALAGQLNRKAIIAELIAQLSTFEDKFARAPRFIDGHLHIHQLPGIREAIVEILALRYAVGTVALRCCDERSKIIFLRRSAPLRALAIGFHGRALRRLAVTQKIPVNVGFSGIYDFSNRIPYGQRFRRFLRYAQPGTLVLCHPGWGAANQPSQREVEYQFLASREFSQMASDFKLKLVRWS